MASSFHPEPPDLPEEQSPISYLVQLLPGAPVVLNIVQQSSGCLTKLYYFRVPQFSPKLIRIAIIWTFQVLFLHAYYS